MLEKFDRLRPHSGEAYADVNMNYGMSSPNPYNNREFFVSIQ